MYLSRRSPACPVTHECSRCSCEVAVDPFLFDLTRDQSTSNLHAFAVTFIYLSIDRKWVCVLSSTHMSHLALRQKAWNFSYHVISSIRATSSLKSVTLSLRPCSRLHDRSRTCLSTSAPVELFEAPPVFADSCGTSHSSWRARFVASVLPSLGTATVVSRLANSSLLFR